MRRNIFVFIFKINCIFKGMKNLNKLIFFVLAGIFFGCAGSPKTKIPEILTAQYEIKTYSEFDRGYEVFMVINQFPDECKINGIILKNKLFDKIQFTKMQTEEIFIEQFLPLHSKQIQNFSPPAADSRNDGIIFDMNGIEIYKEINFKLK